MDLFSFLMRTLEPDDDLEQLGRGAHGFICWTVE